ncbi:MAG: hypothetical protein GX939_05675 [Clostridiaceae bacterium]|jgi:hypothetical protein|nr:hypothetical protein [Clostridiaceae bacterium]
MIPSRPSIASDMASEQRLSVERRHEWGFYVVSSSRELLQHIEGIMNRDGLFGVMDSEGRVHYLVDARKGYPYAARQIFSTASRLVQEQSTSASNETQSLEEAITTVLERYDFNRELRGYRLLYSMLKFVVSDRSLLDPISKRLYPKIARLYGLKVNQVERNVRYLFANLCKRELSTKSNTRDDKSVFLPLLQKGAKTLPSAETIRRLSNEVRRLLHSDCFNA